MTDSEKPLEDLIERDDLATSKQRGSWSPRETKQKKHWYEEQRNLKFWEDQKEERWWWQRRRVNNVEGNVKWKCKGSLSLRIKWQLELKRVPPEKEGKVWKYIMMNYSTARATKANWRVPSNVEHAGIFYHFVLLQHIVYNDAASVPTTSESIMGGI